MAARKKNVKTEKDVQMEGTDWHDKIARHQAYMNKVNATAKSMQQTLNYLAALGNQDQFKKLLDQYRAINTELGQAWLDHFALLVQSKKA